MTALAFFIMPTQTTLYNAALDPVVDLPAGYFVLQSDTDAPDGYIKVAYDDIGGYVKAESVRAVDYTPVTKYETTVRFVCDNDGQPVKLRAAPKKSAEVVAVLPDAERGRCYGSIGGEPLISDAGSTWYYVNASGTRGYVYYAHVAVDATPPNIIEKEPDPVPETPVDVKPKTDDTAQNMSTTAAIIFIVALCIPVPFIMFFLFKKPKE